MSLFATSTESSEAAGQGWGHRPVSGVLEGLVLPDANCLLPHGVLALKSLRPRGGSRGYNLRQMNTVVPGKPALGGFQTSETSLTVPVSGLAWGLQLPWGGLQDV